MKKYTMDDFISKKIAVIVGTKHVDEFLKMCEARGLKWISGHKAADFKPSDMYGENMCIAYGCIFSGLSYGPHETYAQKGLMIVRFCEISDKRRDRYQIIIDCDGDTTTAKMIINGKEVKAARAKRNPDDSFNWKLAASLAFNRLWGEKKAAKPEKEPTYREVKRHAKVGEFIKIVKPALAFSRYRDGEILQVKEFYLGGRPGTILFRYNPADKDGYIQIWPEEYVVLEGYKPSK